MTLSILTEHMDHMKLLKDHPVNVSIDVCKLALEYLHTGPNYKRCTQMAEKLNTTSENLHATIKAIVLLLIDTVKNNVSQTDFESFFVVFSPKHSAIFWQFIASKTTFIQNILKYYCVTDLRYRDLDWRVESRIVSRCRLAEVVPTITILLHLDSEEISENKNKLSDGNNFNNLTKKRTKNVLFRVDPTNLLHVINVLEMALEESKTHRVRNFVKAIQ